MDLLLLNDTKVGGAVSNLSGKGGVQATRTQQSGDQLVDIAAGLESAERADGALPSSTANRVSC